MKRKRPETTVKRIAELGDMLFVAGDFQRQTFERHFHDHFVFGVNFAGAHDFTFGRSRETAGADCVVVIPPGEIHTGEPHQKGEWHYAAIYPDENTLNQLLGTAQWKRLRIAYPYVTNTRANSIFRQSLKAFYAGNFSIAEEHLLLFFSALIMNQESPCSLAKPRPYLVNQAREYLLAHLHQKIRLDDVAAAINADKFQLIRLFNAYEKTSPIHFHKNARVARAIDYLKAGCSIAETANRLGFYDQGHLTNEVRKLFGFTPQQYRQGK